MIARPLTVFSVLDWAWKQDFHGDHHVFFIDEINRISKGGYYSHFNVILQSSGTGKSRTVDEMAKLVFTLPFNLRADIENQGPYSIPC